MKFEIVGSGTMAVVRASGLVMLLATTVVAHEGHVIGTGFAATILHALEHGSGALAIVAAGLLLVRKLRTQARARTLVRERKFL